MAFAQDLPRVRWSETTDTFAGDSVRVKLTNGTVIRGLWASVKADSFNFKVEHTSNRRAVGKGLQTLPRNQIAEVSYGKRRTRGRGWGTSLGIYAFALLAARHPNYGTLAGIVAGGVGGYYLGKAIDYQTRQVTLIPDDQP